MVSGSVAHVEVNHLYLVGIEFPAAVNTNSPNTKPVHKMEWHTMGNSGSSKDMSTRRQQPGLVLSTGLVLSYNGQKSTAVILVGTARPSFPHRYLPWEGTARLPYQPLKCLKLPGAQLMSKGYLNYTHCVRVRVMKEGERKKVTTPGFLKSFDNDSTPQLMALYLLDEEVNKLRELHSAYWEGVRYSEDGVPMGGDQLGGEEVELSEEEEEEHPEVQNSRATEL